MPELVINLTNIDRNLATHQLDGNAARILQRVNTSIVPGRMIRGFGAAATQISPSSTTVTSAYVFRRGDCKRAVLDANTAGTVRLTPGQLARCCGPLPEWDDFAYTGISPSDFATGYYGTGLTSDPTSATVRFYISSTATFYVYPDPVYFGTNQPLVGTQGSNALVAQAGSTTDLGYMFATSNTAYGWMSPFDIAGVFHVQLNSPGTTTLSLTNVRGGSALVNSNLLADDETLTYTTTSTAISIQSVPV